jgi:hypothetical protein
VLTWRGWGVERSQRSASSLPPALGFIYGGWDSTQGQMRKSARRGAANWMALAGQPERRKLELDGWPAD